MLITKQQVQEACNLSPARLNEAMQAGGYTDKYQKVKFLGVNQTGHYVYEVKGYCRVEGEDVTGVVYLKFVRGALSKDFYLSGDY